MGQSLSFAEPPVPPGGRKLSLILDSLSDAEKINALTNLGFSVDEAPDGLPLGGDTTPTGVMADFWGITAPDGWVLANGTTIGDASSAATGRANADTVDLFTLLWNSIADAQAAVSGGRGASAAADYAAHKTITVPNMDGRTAIGFGASSYGAIDCVTLGAVGGEETHVLIEAELAQHSHQYNYVTDGATIASGANFGLGAIATDQTGSSQPHNNIQPSIVCNKIIKL